MSPSIGVYAGMNRCFPRVSGDEPAARKAIGVPYVFSPRERG